MAARIRSVRTYIGPPRCESEFAWAQYSGLVRRRWFGGQPPFHLQIARGQRIARRADRGDLAILGAADRTGMVGRLLVGDDLVEFSRAILRALPDHGGGLAADLARRRLAL